MARNKFAQCNASALAVFLLICASTSLAFANGDGPETCTSVTGADGQQQCTVESTAAAAVTTEAGHQLDASSDESTTVHSSAGLGQPAPAGTHGSEATGSDAAPGILDTAADPTESAAAGNMDSTPAEPAPVAVGTMDSTPSGPAATQPTPPSEELVEDLQRLQALLDTARRSVSELMHAVQQQEDRLRLMYGIQPPAHGGVQHFSQAGMSPAPPAQGWLTHFQPATTLRTQARATVVHAFNQPTDDRAGWDPPRLVVVGDAGGTVYFFDVSGQLLYKYQTGSSSPITALASYGLRRNESVLVTGHEDGEVWTHGVFEVYNASVRHMSVTAVYPNHVLHAGHGPTNLTTGLRVEEPAAPIMHMVPFRALGKQSGRRLLAVWDSNGWLRVQRDDGSVKYAAHSHARQLAAQMNGDLLVGLSATGATVLRSSLTSTPRAIECMGLNGSSIVAATFDPARSYRAYAWSDTGDLLSLVVPHSNRATVCKVSKRVHVGGGGSVSSPAGSLLAGLRGHLLMLRDHPASLLTFNTSAVVRDGTVQETSSAVAEVAERLGFIGGSAAAPGPAVGEEGWAVSDAHPILCTVGRSNFVAMSVGGDQVVLLHSSLPVPRGMDGKQQGKGWTQIIFIGLMCVVAVFQFTKARSGRYGGYSTSASRLRDMGPLRGGGGRGARDGTSAAARLAAYHQALEEIDRAQKSSFPSRAMRRAARMSPVSTRLHERPDAILEEEDEDEYDD